MVSERKEVSIYLLAASLVTTVLLFTLRPTAGAKFTLAGVALICASFPLAGLITAPRSEQRCSSVADRGPGWLAWVLIPYAVWLSLAIARTEGAGAMVSAIGLVLTATVLAVGVSAAVRAANLAALFLVVASLLIALLDTQYVVAGARDLLPVLYQGRAFGLLQHPNGLGQMSALLLMLGWKRRSRVSCAFAVVGLLAAGSQTALLAVVVAVCCVLMVRLLKAISVQYRPVLASFGTVAVLVLAWLVMAHALTVPTLPLSADDLTLTKRTMIWQQLSGGGVPSLGLGGDGLAARIAATIQVGSAHNMWLETWLRDGVPGVVALVIAVLALVIVACRGTDSGLALGGAAMLLVEGMTESSPVHPIFFPFFVALVALPVTLPSKTVTVASVSQETLRMPQVAAQ